MGEVVDLQQAREERKPHNVGKARCTACGHEEVSVAPAGVVWMECSSCHTMRSLFVEHLEREEGKHFVCECGNYAFAIHAVLGVYCLSCGLGHGVDVIPAPPLPR